MFSMSHRLFSGMAKHTQKMRALLPVDFFLTVQWENAIMIVFSSRQAIAPSEVRSFRGRIFYRLRRSDHQCGVQQGSELITAERDHQSDREHRGEAAAGAGEFHGIASFRSKWRAGPELNRPVRAWHPAAELRRPYMTRCRWREGAANIRRQRAPLVPRRSSPLAQGCQGVVLLRSRCAKADLLPGMRALPELHRGHPRGEGGAASYGTAAYKTRR